MLAEIFLQLPIIAGMRNPPFFILTVFLLLQAGQASADENPYFEDLPTVLTASRLPQPLNEAPGAVTVIEREFIKATGYRDLARVFRLVPGMQVGQERGSSQWVTYHGLSTTNPSEMQVLIDGRSVYSPANFGGVDWNSLPVTVDEIERIEIVRGTNAVTYGANAFLGVINIITRHSADEPGSHGALTAGAPGVLDFSAGSRGKVGELGLSLNALRQRDSGFANLYDSRESRVLSLRGDYRLSSVDELSFRLGGSQTVQGAGYPDSVNRNNAQREREGESYSLHAQWTHAPAPGEELILHYYRNQERVKERWDALGAPYLPYFPSGPVVPLDLNRRAVRDHLELQQRSMPGAQTQAVWGLEAQRDEMIAPFIYGGKRSSLTQMGRAFGNLEWKFAPHWQLTGGAALEQFQSEPLRLAPRAFLNWQASRNDTWRAGYARAWGQRPTFEKEGEVLAAEKETGMLIQQPFMPNPDLRQARVDSFELGYLGRFKPMAATLDVRLFRERINGFIYRMASLPTRAAVLNSSSDSAQYVNADQPVTLTGVEYQYKFSPWHQGEWLLNHALIRTQASEALQHRSAPYVASLSWRQGWGHGWSSMLTALRMGPLAGGDGMVPIYNYVARAYTSFDARIAYARRMANGKKIEYSLNAINLGERHQEIADRSQQSLYGNEPANKVSAMVYFGIALEM